MSSETNTIDEKKNNGNPNDEDWSAFIAGVASVIIYIIIFIWILGTCLLYSTKVSRSNIIPTELTNQAPIDLVNANYVKQFKISTEKPFIHTGKYTAQQLKFFKEGPTYVEMLLEYLKPVNSKSFIYDIFKDFLLINNSIITSIYNSLYGLNESILMLFSPFIYLFIIIFYSLFHFWGLFFFQIYKLIKSIIFQNDKDTYFWSKIHPFLNFFLFPFYIFLIVIFSSVSSTLLSIFLIPYSLFGLLGYNYYLTSDTTENGENKINGFLSMLFSFMKYKSSFIMVIISLAILNNSNTHLSNIYVAGSVVAIIILAFMGIYNSELDPSDITQTTKIIKKFQ
jgi:hypothetical protein